MHKFLLPILILILIVCSYYIFTSSHEYTSDKRSIPSDWFWSQRAYPDKQVNFEEYFKAVEQTTKIARKKNLTSATEWQSMGPTNIGGRVTALEWNQVNKEIIYAGAAAGGVWKSTDAGETWNPKTDFLPSLSVGALELDPNNPDILYCGTGEANNSGDSYPGIGVIKSTDAGESWDVIGLKNTRHIGAIKVHPLNSNIIYVAAAGKLYSKCKNRGVYKSIDGGESWEQVFFLNDSTSAIDLELDPTDTSIVYVSMMERMRSPTKRKVAGINSGVYRSTDAGANWIRLGNGLPEPSEQVGRIAIAVAPSEPNYVYALVRISNQPNGSDNFIEGMYKSTNKGESWIRYDDSQLIGSSGTFSWYFGLCEVSPHNPETIYIGDLDLLQSTTGGESWRHLTDVYPSYLRDESQHPDHHALVIDKDNPDNLIMGNDGGIFISTNGGDDWVKKYNLPVSQFYAMAVDYQIPYRLLGGTQDNSSMRTKNGEADGWKIFWGGDGFHCAVDYLNSDIFYGESQYGGVVRTTDGGSTFRSITAGIDKSRTNWSTPYILDPYDPAILYLGSYKLYMTTNRGDEWEAISDDLTKGENGRLGTITAISVARNAQNDERIIYVGADDGTLSVSTNTGQSWMNHSEGLSERYITDVLVDQEYPNIAYVTQSGYNLDASAPHVFRTTDFGENWIDITSNLPDAPVNSIVIDYTKDSTLFIGTDVGVWFTQNNGDTWHILGEALPNSPVVDIVLHEPSQALYAATHGRSIFGIDVSVLTDIQNDNETIQPTDYLLHQNYPNPFNPTTTIEYELSKTANVRLEVFSITGAFVKQLINKTQRAGLHKATFKAENLPSGVYIYNLQVNDYSISKKMILMK